MEADVLTINPQQELFNLASALLGMKDPQLKAFELINGNTVKAINKTMMTLKQISDLKVLEAQQHTKELITKYKLLLQEAQEMCYEIINETQSLEDNIVIYRELVDLEVRGSDLRQWVLSLKVQETLINNIMKILSDNGIENIEQIIKLNATDIAELCTKLPIGLRAPIKENIKSLQKRSNLLEKRRLAENLVKLFKEIKDKSIAITAHLTLLCNNYASFNKDLDKSITAIRDMFEELTDQFAVLSILFVGIVLISTLVCPICAFGFCIAETTAAATGALAVFSVMGTLGVYGAIKYKEYRKEHFERMEEIKKYINIIETLQQRAASEAQLFNTTKGSYAEFIRAIESGIRVNIMLPNNIALFDKHAKDVVEHLTSVRSNIKTFLASVESTQWQNILVNF